jgi:2-dehydropantoate 2-reductase
VVGAGAVGQYLGEALRGAGCEVVYAPRHLDEVTPVAADLAIVAVKSFDTSSAIATLQRALSADSDATLLTPQNGVGNEERLADAFGADRVVSAALTVPVEVGADGKVVAANKGGLALAPVGAVAHSWLYAAFTRTRIPVTITADYRALKWSKLALNIVTNASCAILDVLPGDIVKLPEIFALELEAVREVRAVMRPLRIDPIDLPRYPVRAFFAAASLPDALARGVLGRRVAGARGRKAPSLLLDVRAGRGRSEVGALNGAVAEAVAFDSVPTPVNAAFARLADGVARDPSLRDDYRNNPAALLAAVDDERRRIAGWV